VKVIMIGGRGDALRDTRADDLCHCRLLVKSLHPAKSSPAMLMPRHKKTSGSITVAYFYF